MNTMITHRRYGKATMIVAKKMKYFSRFVGIKY